MQIEKLYPECKDYLWGGERLKTVFGKITDKTPCAESWELSFHKDGLTKLSNGKTLKEVATSLDLGTNCSNFEFFPMLIKFIDAENNLSVQVHPSDDYALKYENSYGKTEMWYVMDAKEGAGIYLGFNRTVTSEEYENAIKTNTLTDLLNFYEVKKGECYFIPSGTIHAICSGCLICEIQQNCNLTYRVYDYGRKDKFGKERELHVEKALKVTNLNKLNLQRYTGEFNVTNKYFNVDKIIVNGSKTLSTNSQSFMAVSCVLGEGTIANQKITTGDTFFVPANYGEFTISGNLEILTSKV